MDLARVDNDGIVIRLSWNLLTSASQWCPRLQFFDEATGNYQPPKVVDVKIWAEEVVRELNAEGENGDTVITDIFDQVFERAVEHGAEGLQLWDYPE